MGLSLIELIIFISIIALPVIALIDIIQSMFKDDINKIIWVLLVIFLPALGTILYFLLGINQKIPKTSSHPGSLNTK